MTTTGPSASAPTDVPAKPLPDPTPVSAPYWRALTEHRIEIQYSPSSDTYVFYPRLLAPGTLADDLVWRQISGAATLYTYTVADRPTAPPWADAVPQILAVVQWDEGPKLSTELVDVDPATLEIGMRLRPVFCDVAPDVTVLRYTAA